MPVRWKGSTPINTAVMFVPQQEAWVVERMGKFHRNQFNQKIIYVFNLPAFLRVVIKLMVMIKIELLNKIPTYLILIQYDYILF